MSEPGGAENDSARFWGGRGPATGGGPKCWTEVPAILIKRGNTGP